MAQEQKESIDRTFDQFMQMDLGFRTGVNHISGLEWTFSKIPKPRGRGGKCFKFSNYGIFLI